MPDRDFENINCQFCGADLGVFTLDITEEGKNITSPGRHKNLFWRISDDIARFS